MTDTVHKSDFIRCEGIPDRPHPIVYYLGMGNCPVCVILKNVVPVTQVGFEADGRTPYYETGKLEVENG